MLLDNMRLIIKLSIGIACATSVDNLRDTRAMCNARFRALLHIRVQRNIPVQSDISIYADYTCVEQYADYTSQSALAFERDSLRSRAVVRSSCGSVSVDRYRGRRLVTDCTFGYVIKRAPICVNYVLE